jgi:probable rRNA maturation factor
MNIVIANRQRTRKANPRVLKQIVLALLTELEVTEAELGINLVAEEEMALVNETFLQHSGSTDVITFDHMDARPGTQDAKSQLHGELFICVDDAVSQARQFGTDWQSELVRYIVHGVLHLLGYDDLAVAARRKMKRVENRLVRWLAKRFELAQLSGAAKLGA